MNRPARVLLLAKGLGYGGTERLIDGMVRHLDRGRFKVEVAYVLPWKNGLVPAIASHGVPIHCLGQGRAGSAVWVRRLQKLAEDRQYDIVHTHMPSVAVAARVVFRDAHPVLIHTEHNVWDQYRRPTYWGNALTYHRNARVLAVSQGVADSVRQLPLPSRRLPPVEVLVHGIDPDAIPRGGEAARQAREKLALGDEPVVGTVGNFTAKKDHASLLLAVAMLMASHPRLRLVIVGSGPLEEETRRRAAELGLGHRVIFTGARPDAQSLLPAFDVFALSSRYEGLSIALLEAFAAGLPCVATSVGGIPEAVEHERTGLLVPPGDPSALAAALLRLLSDSHLRVVLGEQAACRVRDFGLAKAVRRIEAVYETVLADR